jgi:dihydrodipicolinate synthase/N-acetylneuraminate lyase
VQLSEILLHSPELAHFATDPAMGVGMMLGARGCYSYWVNTLPRWHRRYMDACLAGDWATAAACHRKLIGWELKHIRPLREAGYLHGIVGKARAGLTGFLEDTGLTRPPYYPVDPGLIDQMSAAFKVYWAEEIRTGV